MLSSYGLVATQCQTERICKVVLQELTWLAGFDEDTISRKRSLFSIVTETVLLALHRPVAV